MKHFVKRKSVALKVRGQSVNVAYREQRDGRRGQLSVNGQVLEIGPTPKIKRRYNALVTTQFQQLGQSVPDASLIA